jgi:hypothetical protein
MNKGRPISPDEVTTFKRESIPPEVFDAFNELIAEKFVAGRAVVTQDEVIERILKRISGSTRVHVFDGGWLDVEDIYRQAGWSVDYDKPAFNETFKANFTFTKRG